jgi:hypothetical protein
MNNGHFEFIAQMLAKTSGINAPSNTMIWAETLKETNIRFRPDLFIARVVTIRKELADIVAKNNATNDPARLSNDSPDNQLPKPHVKGDSPRPWRKAGKYKHKSL